LIITFQDDKTRTVSVEETNKMATLSREHTGGVETRVNDYLNDQLQTSTDLDNLDTLLENVQRQQALLQKQLDDARKAYDDAFETASTRAAAVQLRSDSLQQEQADIDRTLMIMTQSDSMEEASRAFAANILIYCKTRTSSMQKLAPASGSLLAQPCLHT
jgi:hypothetical protein